jgi:hypothetical protein
MFCFAVNADYETLSPVMILFCSAVIAMSGSL